MQRLTTLLLTLLVLPAMASETTAFINVNVVPMAADVVNRQQTVVVRNGTIAAIGPVDEVPIPENALRPGAFLCRPVPQAQTIQYRRVKQQRESPGFAWR